MARIAYNDLDAEAFASNRHIAEAGLAGWRDAVHRHLGPVPGMRVLDLGSGTGMWSQAFTRWYDGVEVVAVEPSEAMRTRSRHPVLAGEAGDIPLPDRSVDAVVSGLALNIVPDPVLAATEIVRILRPGGVAGAYVWDYADGMGMLRHFWAAAAALDPAAAGLDEGKRFPLCDSDALTRLWSDTGLGEVRVRAVEVPTVFADFDDYWLPFLGGQGPAPGYVTSLSDDRRRALRDLLHDRLPIAADGSISLTARAWAVRGVA